MIDQNVLLITRSNELAENISKILMKSGLKNINRKSSMKDTYAQCSKTHFSFIIYDLSLERNKKCNGIRKIISIDPQIKIFLLAGLEHRGLILKALYYGAKEFTFKPLNSTIFTFKIRRILSIKPNPTDLELLISIYNQIIENIWQYLDQTLMKQVQKEITMTIGEFAKEHQYNLYFDEISNQLSRTENSKLNFHQLNQLLNNLLNICRKKVEDYIPYATSLFIESFRMVYMKNHIDFKKIEKNLSLPDWLQNELKFMPQLIEFLFSHEKN
ncbi:MAG: hypothetical protein ACTSYF_12680 [Promethearchaeota archaeon]